MRENGGMNHTEDTVEVPRDWFQPIVEAPLMRENGGMNHTEDTVEVPRDWFQPIVEALMIGGQPQMAGHVEAAAATTLPDHFPWERAEECVWTPIDG